MARVLGSPLARAVYNHEAENADRCVAGRGKFDGARVVRMITLMRRRIAVLVADGPCGCNSRLISIFSHTGLMFALFSVLLARMVTYPMPYIILMPGVRLDYFFHRYQINGTSAVKAGIDILPFMLSFVVGMPFYTPVFSVLIENRLYSVRGRVSGRFCKIISESKSIFH